MEEEYRLHKTHASVDFNASGIHQDGSSTKGLKSPTEDRPDTARTVSDIPTIRISTESARTPNGDTQSKFPNSENGQEVDEPQELASGSGSGSGSGSETDTAVEAGQAGKQAESELEKPKTAHEKEDASGAAGVISGEGDEAVSAFSNKRLCERWLGESPNTNQSTQIICRLYQMLIKQTTCSCRSSLLC